VSAADEWQALAAFTPARVALGRAGNALPTKRVLEFQLAHARARDAVGAPFDAESLAKAISPAVIVETKAKNRTAYLENPGLGKMLSDASKARLRRRAYDAALIVADGLSSTAIQTHGAALAKAILASLSDWKWAPTTIVTNGRVAIGDEIAKAVNAEFAVVLIGERPGLSAADSVGIYLTRAPRPGITSDAERNCISNARPGGLALDDAAHRLAWLMTQARRLRVTGVALKEDAPDSLTARHEADRLAGN
jgi:ethanolamine ammonia-lyase small subunit